MRAALRAFFAALLLIGLVLASGPGPAQADTPDAQTWPKPRFISYNVCGAACAIYDGSKDAWRDKIVNAMDGWDADLVMLQEMCYGQWTLLRDSLGDRPSGNKYDSVWGATLASASGCAKWGTDKRYGLAIFAKGAPGTINNGTRSVNFLPEETPGEDRILLCARTTVTGRTVRACNTHIDYSYKVIADPDPKVPPTVLNNPKAQIQKVADITRGFANGGDPVVLAGDFNQLPKDADMAPLYAHSGGTGVFEEVDENDKDYFTGIDCPQSGDRCRSGEATAEPGCSPKVSEPGKIDYIFVSYYWFTTVRGDSAACTPGMSDHHLLRGAAAWEH
ncbi:endonuclease/exonuclease/phosphatase family protein [Streptomyces avidinii]|uniref:endonuclease/exonuclease/phosphatase family protein n=1 Tax=Streptomyces avidinii TaxID=1895 RepID=UPI0037BC3F17